MSFNFGQAVQEVNEQYFQQQMQQEREQIVRLAVAKIEAAGILTDLELSALKFECGVC